MAKKTNRHREGEIFDIISISMLLMNLLYDMLT